MRCESMPVRYLWHVPRQSWEVREGRRCVHAHRGGDGRCRQTARMMYELCSVSEADAVPSEKSGRNLGGHWMAWINSFHRALVWAKCGPRINNFLPRARLVWAKSRRQTWRRRQRHHRQRNARNIDVFGPDGARLLYDFGPWFWPPGSKLFCARHSRLWQSNWF